MHCHTTGKLNLLEAGVLFSFCILVCLFVCFKSLSLSSFNYGCFPLIELVFLEEMTGKARLEVILPAV